MKLVIVFLLLATAYSCNAQRLSNRLIQSEKLKAVVDMLKYNPLTLIAKTGAKFSFALVARINKAVQEVLSLLRNASMTFLPSIPDFITWSEEEQNGRNSIFGFLGGGRRFANTTWNYTEVNYVKQGMVSPVKNQEKCGSCYAFGALAAVEAQMRVAGIGKDILSEQQIVDCSYKRYRNAKGPLNLGCVSGTSYHSMQFVSEFVMGSDKDYPYTSKHGDCKPGYDTPRTSGPKLNFQTVLPDNEDHLAYLLNKNGPLVVYIKVTPSFNYFSKGVYNDRSCKGAVNHAMLLSGLETDEDGREYWILKNSWGPKWGDNGYINFQKGLNLCDMITNNVTIASYGDIITQ